MRVRAVSGLTLLLLSPLLVACSEDKDSTEPGDVIRAREDDQFKDGKEVTVVLPTGRLLINSGAPVDSADSEETRAREDVDAPSGAVLVPITWQYDTWASDRLDGIFDTDVTPIVDLVSEGQDYRLPPPDTDAEAGESFYVVVDGDGEDRSLELDFEGVLQTVDLKTGALDKGDAQGLYDIEDTRLKTTSCDEAGKWFEKDTVSAEFSCDVIGPVLTPYADGKWAPAGDLYLVLTLSTELRVLTEIEDLTKAARYAATSVKVTTSIDGEKPTSSLPNEDGTNACPIPGAGVCGWSRHLIFAVPADDGEQGPLTAEVVYRLLLATSFGDWDPPTRQEVDAEEDIKLWDE